MAEHINDAKRALRAELRERRTQHSDAVRQAYEVGIASQLDALVAHLGARSVSCYLSLVTEPGTREFIAGALERGICILLPITRPDGLLDWAVAQVGGGIVEGFLGMPEPDGDVLSPRAVEEVDLMIIPAAAVDHTGMRLGWGRGYFDRTLGSMRSRPPVYAVVFDSELVPDVPSDAHDRGVDGIVTPTRTISFTDPVR